MQRTLKELALKDGDALLVLEQQSFDSSVFSRSGDMVTVTTPSDCRWLQVEFQLHKAGKEGERKKTKVPASGNMLMSEVKQTAIDELQLKDQLAGVECCLRQLDRTGKLLPPVCEELNVRDAGVRLMTTMVLCPGAAPKASQLFLHFCVGTASSAGTAMDIVVEQTWTVAECLKAMLKAVGLEGNSWHLRRLDWCEDVGEPLMDKDASLAELKISHGETLVVTEGELPPKGFLKLSVWLSLNSTNDSAVSIETDFNHTNNGFSEGEKLGVMSAELRAIGQVEITDEATLEDLKTQVLTLPALQHVCFPSPAFLRVWQLEGNRPARILRGQQLTLRKLKLANDTDICVQQLMTEEDLGPKEVLLHIQMGIPGERCYYPPEELIWDATRDSSPRSLHTALAVHYGLCPDSLLLAKHQPDKHIWDPISNWSQQVSKRKKKKKAESLLGAPFHLKDGDKIGIKNLLIDSNRDFCTVEDEQDQQRLREQAEQCTKEGKSAGSVDPHRTGPEKKAGPTNTRKPEVALSINVGTFR